MRKVYSLSVKARQDQEFMEKLKKDFERKGISFSHHVIRLLKKEYPEYKDED